MTTVKQWRAYIRLAKRYFKMEAELEKLEKEYESESDRLGDEGWLTFAGGIQWENNVNFHPGCKDCHISLYNAICKKLNIKP